MMSVLGIDGLYANFKQNEILCNCGTSYCYLCGSEIEQHGGDHFTDPRGCPRYYRRGDPRVRWDEVVSPTDTPSDDDQLENELHAGIDESADHNARHVEPLNPSASDQWRLAANHLEEAYRMGRIEGDGIERGYGPWYNLWMEILIRGARHMLAMLSNGIGSEAPTQEQRMENVHRRMRFAHNGLLFRFALSRIRRHLGVDFELPGGNDAYALLEPFSRRLRFQPGAVPNDYDERQQEWVTLRKVIQDQLHVQHPEQHLLRTAWEGLQNYRTIWARALLQPVSDLLLILERNWKRDNFTLADSADLRNGRNLLQERLRTLSNEAQTNAMFRNLGDEPRTICEIAELFANRLFEDDGSTSTINWETQDINRRAEYCFSRTWSYEIMDTMEIETANLNQARPEAIPGRFGELYPNIVAMNNAAENFLAQPDIPDGISDHHLANFRRILNIYTRRIGEPDAQGNLNTDILAGDGPLGSIFFYMLHVMERIINQNVDRHVSQRSSISSNANNAVREDRALIDNEYIAALSARAELDGPLSPMTNFTLQLLAPLRRLLVRMDEPGRWDNATNQQDFDQLREWLWRYDAGTLEEPGWPTRAGNRRLMRVWARRYPGAVDDPAINPARTARERDREELCDELNEVAVLTAHLSDSTYVRGFEQRIHQTRRDLWQDFTNDPPQIFTDLISFLQRLRTASDYHALPLELQSGQARVQMEHYNTRLRQFDVRNSAVGDLRDFPRLWDIWNRVTNYGTSPAPTRSSHHSDPA